MLSRIRPSFSCKLYLNADINSHRIIHYAFIQIDGIVIIQNTLFSHGHEM